MPKYRKKPIVIEAVQWTGDNFQDLIKLFKCKRRDFGNKGDSLIIYTLEGSMSADAGDYIIKGIAGEIYPCREGIFLASYDEVTE